MLLGLKYDSFSRQWRSRFTNKTISWSNWGDYVTTEEGDQPGDEFICAVMIEGGKWKPITAANKWMKFTRVCSRKVEYHIAIKTVTQEHKKDKTLKPFICLKDPVVKCHQEMVIRATEIGSEL